MGESSGYKECPKVFKSSFIVYGLVHFENARRSEIMKEFVYESHIRLCITIINGKITKITSHEE